MSLWGIAGASFWRDEAATLSAVRRSMPMLWRMLEHTDVVHALYYLILWPLVRLIGFGELGARLPSAVAMLAAAAGIAAIGRRLVSSRAGLAAGLTFALLPVTSRYGQEARSYATVLALAVLASYLFLRVIEAGVGGTAVRRWLVAYTAVLALMACINLMSLLIVPGHALTLAWSASPGSARPSFGRPGRVAVMLRRRHAGWLIAVAAMGFLVSPLAVLAWSQRDGTQRFLARTTFQAVGSLPGRLTGSWLALPAILALAFMGLAASGPARAAVTRLCLPWLLLPPLLLLGTSLVTPVYSPRYIVFCVPALALLTGSGLDAIADRTSGPGISAGSRASAPSAPLRWHARADLRPGGAIITGLAVIALLGVPDQVAIRTPDGHGDNIRQVGQILAGHEHTGDAIVYLWPWWRQISAAYPAAFSSLRDVSLRRSPAQDGNFIGTQFSVTQVRRRLARARRAWLVEFQRFQPYAALNDGRWKVVRQWHASDFVLTLYVRQ